MTEEENAMDAMMQTARRIKMEDKAYGGAMYNGPFNDTASAMEIEKYKTQMPDEHGKVRITRGNVFITPTNNGFILYSRNDSNRLEINTFSDVGEMLEFMKDMGLMDITSLKVTDSI